MGTRFRRVLAGATLAATLLFSLCAFSVSANRALVYPSGRVLVQGVPVTNVTTVFIGDHVVTSVGATAAIIVNGKTTVIPSNSHFTFGDGTPIEDGEAGTTFFQAKDGPNKCPTGHGNNGHDCRPISPARP